MSDKKNMRIAANRALTPEEMALLELYQRQDALSTQLWLQFLLANAAVVAVIALITTQFTPSQMLWGVRLTFLLSPCVLLVWMVFTVGGLYSLQNSQKILWSIAHQIHGDVGDKTELFTRATNSTWKIALFHILVDLGVFALCLLLISKPDASQPSAPAPPASSVQTK